ncbi:MAG: hypothetical protein R3Y54_14035, partial [Eubacteriales bacterium]
LVELLHKEKRGDGIDLYVKYKSRESGKVDLDDSDGNFLPMRVLYNTLWGRMDEEGDGDTYTKNNGNPVKIGINGYMNFRKSYIDEIGKNVLWGADCVNSVQTQLNLVAEFLSAEVMCEDPNDSKIKIEDAGFRNFCSAHGCIGDYVLVPAYFNGRGRKKGNDNWQVALKHLKDNGWVHMLHYAKRKDNILGESDEEGTDSYKARQFVEKNYGTFNKEHFSQYINTMFLWDYVEKKGKDYNVAKLDHDDVAKWLKNVEIAIQNRGIFMSGMLLIATNMDLKIEQGEEDMYPEWKVSDLYKKLMKEVFATNQVFSGYDEVLQAMEDCLSPKECNQVKDYFEQIEKLIVNS